MESDEPPRNTPWERSSDILSRVLATVVMMVLPGAAGAWLDDKLKFGIFMPIGFLLGILFGMTGLIYTLRRIQSPNPNVTSKRDDEPAE
ncbi:MAG: AtpZ/AtpI family protein [Pirellulales bacterium]